jgi:phosphoglycerate dehydrogenase-like enzyme
VTDRTILVLRRGTHGLPAADLAAAVRARRPDDDVRLARTRTEELAMVEDAEVVAGVDFDDELLARADALRLFSGYAAGYDHLPLSAFADRGVAVTTGSGIHGPNMAEHLVGAMLVFSRRFDEGWRRERERRWDHYRAGELRGSTVTVVGLGAIGTATVDRLAPFGVRTVGARYSPGKGGPTDEVVGLSGPDFEAALAETEYLLLACPLTDETRGLVDAAAFETLPPEAVVVNVARGPVVDTDALVDAVRRSAVRGAYLDVTDPEPLPEDHPLWALEDVHVTPHMAGSTPEYFERAADILARNLDRVDETGAYRDLENQVAGPGVD